MLLAEFRERFNDMDAGFVSWIRWSNSITVVSCAVYDTFAHERGWLAAAAEDRASAASLLKACGVHGLKFKRAPASHTPGELIDAAVANVGSVVAWVPEGNVETLRDVPGN